MPLTKCDREGLPYLIVVTRTDGSQYVIEERHTRKGAERKAARYREHLEGVRGVQVEEIGQTTREQIAAGTWTGTVCRHCQERHVSRPRGLCWRCYYTPGVKERYDATSKYGRRYHDLLRRIDPCPCLACSAAPARSCPWRAITGPRS